MTNGSGTACGVDAIVVSNHGGGERDVHKLGHCNLLHPPGDD